jgi:hypothetical protein
MKKWGYGIAWLLLLAFVAAIFACEPAPTVPVSHCVVVVDTTLIPEVGHTAIIIDSATSCGHLIPVEQYHKS